MIFRKTLAAAVACSLAWGCAPKRDLGTVLPALDAPDTWVAGDSAVTGDTLSWEWWKAFESAELNDLVREALARNYDLQVAAASVEAAAAQARMAGAPLWPSVSAEGAARRSKQNFIGFPDFGPGGGEDVLSSLSTTYGVSMNLSWEVDLWGRLRQGRLAGVAAYQAARADYAGAQLSLAAQVCKAWFAAVESRQQAALARATAESWADTQAQTEARYERGLAQALALRQARSNLASVRSALAGAEMQARIAVRQLEVLLRRYPGAQLSPGETLPRAAGTVPAGLPAGLLSRRPDLAAAERRLVGAGAAVASRKAALYPALNLTASGGTSSAELSDLTDGDFSVWSLLARITQPIFQGGRLRAQVDEAEAREKQAWQGFGAALLTALMEVETALDNEQWLADQEAALETAATEAGRALELARDQYARGIIPFLNLLEAQRAAATFESRYLTAQRRRLEGRVDLVVALGGGFTAAETSSSPTRTKP